MRYDRVIRTVNDQVVNRWRGGVGFAPTQAELTANSHVHPLMPHFDPTGSRSGIPALEGHGRTED